MAINEPGPSAPDRNDALLFANIGKANSAPPSLTDREPPRLGIAHLFVWIAASAICLAGARQYSEAVGQQRLNAITTVLWSFDAPFRGACLAGLALFLYRCVRGAGFARQPGEWLLIIYGAAVTIWLVFQLAMGHTSRGDNNRSLAVVLGLMAMVTYVVEAALFAVAARRVKAWPAWQVAFWLLFAIQIIRAAQPFLTGILWSVVGGLSIFSIVGFTYLPSVVASVVLIIATLVDWPASRRRPWTHWVGIAAGVASGMTSLMAIAVSLFD
jgi:hypothetical protein